MSTFLRKLMRITPRRWSILVVLTTIAASSVLAFSGFSRNVAHEAVPSLLGHSNTVDIPGDAVALKSGKSGKPDPAGLKTGVLGQTSNNKMPDGDGTVVTVNPVKPKIFHGDVRQLPQVKAKIKKAKPEPKEPSAELPATAQPDAALQPFAPAAPAPTPSASFAGL